MAIPEVDQWSGEARPRSASGDATTGKLQLPWTPRSSVLVALQGPSSVSTGAAGATPWPRIFPTPPFKQLLHHSPDPLGMESLAPDPAIPAIADLSYPASGWQAVVVPLPCPSLFLCELRK